MPDPSDVGRTTALERLCALVDGDNLTPEDWRRASQAWADDAAWRERWHAYHLIGDALRSDELAHGAEGGASFLATFRQRLAAEPVVLAPAPLPAAEPAVRRRLGWAAPAAVAAGFVAVAGVLVALRQPAAPEGGSAIAAAPARPGAVPVSTAPAALPGSAPLIVVNGQMIRDARLDRYLAAHRGAVQGMALGAPGAVVHGVVELAPADGK